MGGCAGTTPRRQLQSYHEDAQILVLREKERICALRNGFLDVSGLLHNLEKK